MPGDAGDAGDAADGRAARPAFEPWGATTGIGSLPHERVGDALDLIAATCPEVPYWPQLPRSATTEAPLAQALGPVADVVDAVDGLLVARAPEHEVVAALERAAVRPPSPPAGLAAFVEAVAAGAFPSRRAVKGQLYGPATIAGLLRVDGRAAVQRPRLVGALARALAAQARAQARMLATCGVPVLLLVDEPGLGVVTQMDVESDLAAALDVVVASARAGGAVAGVHLCAGPVGAAIRGPVPGLVPGPAPVRGPVDGGISGRPGLVSVDLWHPAVAIGPIGADTPGTPDPLVAWGAAAVGGPPPPLVAAQVLRRLAAGPGDRRQGLRRSLLTPACGLGLVGIADAHRLSHGLRDLAAQVRRMVLDGLDAAYLPLGATG